MSIGLSLVHQREGMLSYDSEVSQLIATGVDRIRFYGYLHKFYRTYENTHYQFTHDALESEPFKGITKQFISISSLPGAQIYLQERKSWYNEEFQAFVDHEHASVDGEQFKLAGT
jgi:hypothetical protein|tara:strand:- start:51 stop:395 length:345 start_codon:yes stop_codon:yes gene_type:complete